MKLLSGDDIQRVDPQQATDIQQNVSAGGAIRNVAAQIGQTAQMNANALKNISNKMYDHAIQHEQRSQRRQAKEAELQASLAYGELTNSFNNRTDYEKFQGDFDSEAQRIEETVLKNIQHPELKENVGMYLQGLNQNSRLNMDQRRRGLEIDASKAFLNSTESKLAHSLAKSPSALEDQENFLNYGDVLDEYVDQGMITRQEATKRQQDLAMNVLRLKLGTKEGPDLQAALDDPKNRKQLELLSPQELNSLKSRAENGNAAARAVTTARQIMDAAQDDTEIWDMVDRTDPEIAAAVERQVSSVLRRRDDQKAAQAATLMDRAMEITSAARSQGQDPQGALDTWFASPEGMDAREALTFQQRDALRMGARYSQAGDPLTANSIMNIAATDPEMGQRMLDQNRGLLSQQQEMEISVVIGMAMQPEDSFKPSLTLTQQASSLYPDDTKKQKILMGKVGQFEADYITRVGKEPTVTESLEFMKSIAAESGKGYFLDGPAVTVGNKRWMTDVEQKSNEYTELMSVATQNVSKILRTQNLGARLTDGTQERISGIVRAGQAAGDSKQIIMAAVMEEYSNDLQPQAVNQNYRHVPFVARVLNPSRNTAIMSSDQFGRPVVETHKLAAEQDPVTQDWMVFPMISQIGGELIEHETVAEAMEHAKSNNNFIPFNTKSGAIRYSKEYKTDAFNKWAEQVTSEPN